MFALVKFHNDAFYVVPGKNVCITEGKTCVVKYNGGKYSALLVKRSASPYGKTKRCRWSDSEKDSIVSKFGEISALEKLPSLADCLDAIRQSPALCNRTPEQIKSWIDNQRRHKRNYTKMDDNSF